MRLAAVYYSDEMIDSDVCYRFESVALLTLVTDNGA